MPADQVADDVEKQLFPGEWRNDLERQLVEGVNFTCPHCGDSISFQPDIDSSEDVETRRTVIDRLLARGMWVVQINDEDCKKEGNREKPFYRVLTLGNDGKIQASTLMPDAMPEFLEDSARAAAIAERSITKISEAAAADVRAVFYHILTGSFDVPEGDLDGVPDAELMEIFDDLLNYFVKDTRAHMDENDEAGARLVALLGSRATANDRDPDKTSLQELVDKVWAVHSEFVEAIATAIGVNLTQDAAADTKTIFERLQDLASNNPNTIIEIGVALGMDEGEMRRKMLATPAAATGDEKVAWAELAKSVMDTAKVMLARFMYACEAAGLDKQTRDGDPITAMRALSAIIGENRRVAAVREGGAQGRGR